jgi:energy-coupling factor transporter transmembrane protein EcfT
MFLRALDLAQALALAMDARGFGAREKRTSIIHIEMTRIDKIIVAACILAVVAGLILRFLGIGVLIEGYL